MSDWLSDLLNPIGLLWAALILYALWRAKQRQWRAAAELATVALLIHLVGATRLPAILLASLERPYAGKNMASLPRVDAIVMLGGLGTASTYALHGLQLEGAVERAITAVDVARLRNARALVLGGGYDRFVPGNPGEGELVRRWMTAWDLTPLPVHTLGGCRNTRDEAVRTRDLAATQGWKRIVLITSAAHMRRAEAVFRAVGLEVVPYACDFAGLDALPHPAGWFGPPGLQGFNLLNSYLHEFVGWWMYRWRGWV